MLERLTRSEQASTFEVQGGWDTEIIPVNEGFINQLAQEGGVRTARRGSLTKKETRCLKRQNHPYIHYLPPLSEGVLSDQPRQTISALREVLV
jgi:hypothetical protein